MSSIKNPLAGFRFHDLRHQAITELAESQASDQTIMAIAGHVSPRMLRHYSHIRKETAKKALDALNSGLRIDKNNADILLELQRMGQRGAPPVPFLRRDNPLNFYLGKLFGKLGLR